MRSALPIERGHRLGGHAWWLLVSVLVLATVVLAAPAAASHIPTTESHLDASCESGPVADETSSTGPVGHIGGGVTAAANAATLTLDADAAVQATRQDPPHRYCSVFTRFDNAVTVAPGTSGRATGDPVSLAVTVRMHGVLGVDYVGPARDPRDQRAFSAWTQVGAQFSLTDPHRPVCAPGDPEDCRPARLAQFWAEARKELEGTFAWAMDPDGAMTHRYRWGYELTSNRGNRLDGASDHTDEVCPAWPIDMHLCPGDAEIPPLPHPDYQGMRTVFVDTFVGAELDLHGVLSILPQTSTDARASADFFQLGGLSVDLAPAPGFEGLDLVYALGAPRPSVSISDATVPEGDTGVATATFTVALSAPSAQPVSVGYITVDGTAGAADYLATSGTLTFAPGERERTVAVSVVGDRATEAEETFFVDLGSADGVIIADGRGLGTIVDDDQAASPAQVLAEVEAELENRVDEGRGTEVADKLEDALHKVNAALSKLQAGDRQGCLGELEGAVAEISAAMYAVMISTEDGISLLDRLIGAGRGIADEAIAAAEARSGDPDKIAEAEALLARGDARHATWRYKDAVAAYKDAVSKADGA